MNLKTVVPLGAAVVLGLVAAIVARQLVTGKPAVAIDRGSSVELVEVVVASRDLAPGETLDAEDLTVARVEARNAPSNVSGNPSSLFNRVAKLQIPKGQIIHETLLAEAGVSGGLPGVIPPGFRAMTIEVNEFTGVAGLLQPGNRIDVLARFNDGENGLTTRTVVQNVEIIAVGTELANTAPGRTETSAIAPDAQPQKKTFPMAVTVVVTPADAERLDLAAANQARLALRASLDTIKAPVAGATMASLKSDPASPVPAVEITSHTSGDDLFTSTPAPVAASQSDTASAKHKITVVRGGVVSEMEVERSSSGSRGLQAGGGDLYAPMVP